VVFDRKIPVGTEFHARDLLRPTVPLLPDPAPPRVLPTPAFLTPPNFFRHSWAEMVRVALTPYPVHLTNVSTQLFRQLPVRPGRFAFRPLTASLGLHLLGALCLPFLLTFLPFSADETMFSQVNREAIVYYRFARPQQQRVPKILPPGPGSIPGNGTRPEMPPLRGATKASGALFAVSRPKLPDNAHQTILQAQSAPELRIKTDLKLPNLVVQNVIAPKPRLDFHPDSVRPIAPTKKDIENVEPSPKVTGPTGLTTATLPSLNHPARLAIPVGAAPAPNLPASRAETPEDGGAPEIVGATGTFGQGLLVLGTEPADPRTLVALPPGNRLGQFSLAPGGSGAGSPGGTPEGVAGGGSGGAGAGGSGSVGVGHGTYGGGGGNSGAAGIVSLRGTGGATENPGDPNFGITEGMVYALPKISRPRRLATVVTAGPMGGGGLGVYGALHCGKIYTVLLPTSGKSWTLQFCQTLAPGTATSTQSRSPVVHLEQALLPPEAESRYDFEHLPLPPEKTHKLIILKGTIRPEGRVENLSIQEGLLPQMDAAALRAFSKWTFKPAMREGKAVSVDILVGIPGDGPAPASVSGAATKIAGEKTDSQGAGKSY